MIKRTDKLNAGDLVQLPGGIVHTVDEIADSGYVNYRDEPIFYVNYREGRTREWSSGNSGISPQYLGSAGMIRQAIATTQLESARADLAFLRYQAEPWTSIGQRWLAEDRVWFWSLDSRQPT